MSKQSTTKGFAILSLAGILAKVLSVLYVPLLKRTIGLEGMGIYGKTYDVFTFIYALTNIGMQTAIAKYVSELTAMENHRDALRTFKIARTLLFIVGTLCTIALMASANFIANKTSNPSIYMGLIFLAPTISITSVLVCYRAYFQGRNEMKPVAISTVVEQIANVLLSLICAYILIGKSVELGSAGGTVGTSLGALIAVVYLIYIYNAFKVERKVRKEQSQGVRVISSKRIIITLIKYGFPITLSAGLQNFGALVDMFNVSNRLLFAGFSLSESNMLYGILNEYKTLLYVPMVIITALGTVILPAISSALVLKNKKEIKEKITFALKITFVISIPCAFGLAVLSDEVYTLFYGDSKGYELMLLGSVVLIFMAVVQIQNVILQGISQFYFIISSMMVGIILKVGANYYFVGQRNINIQGAVIGGFLCFFMPMVMNHSRIKRKLKIRISLLNIAIKPIFASIYMTIILFICKIAAGTLMGVIGNNKMVGAITTVLMVAIGSFGYLHALIYLGGIRKREIEGFSPKLVRIMPGILTKHLR